MNQLLWVYVYCDAVLTDLDILFYNLEDYRLSLEETKEQKEHFQQTLKSWFSGEYYNDSEGTW